MITAESSNAAAKKVTADKPNLVLVDVSLPDQNGYEACRSLKQLLPGVPVVIMSSKQVPYDPEKGKTAGADDFIDKPFDTQQLIDKVSKLLTARPAAPAAPPAATASPVRPVVAPAAAAPAAAVARPVTGTSPGTPAAPGAPAAAARPAVAPVAAPARAPIGFPSPAARQEPKKPASIDIELGSPSPSPVVAKPAVTPAQPAAVAKPAVASPAPAAAAPTHAPAQPAAHAAAAVAKPAVALPEALSDKLQQIGLTATQVEAVLALSREVVEQVVWEVVPVLAETLIKEEIARLTKEA